MRARCTFLLAGKTIRRTVPGSLTAPAVRDRGFAFDVENAADAQTQGIDRAVAVFKRGSPAVFVNG